MKRMIDGTSRGGQKKRARSPLCGQGRMRDTGREHEIEKWLSVVTHHKFYTHPLVLLLTPLILRIRELAPFRIVENIYPLVKFFPWLNPPPEAKRRRDKNEGRKIVGAINSCKILRFVPKPTNFLLPFASSKSLWKKRKPPSLLSFSSLLSSLREGKIEDSRLTRPIIHELASGQWFRNQRR